MLTEHPLTCFGSNRWCSLVTLFLRRPLLQLSHKLLWHSVSHSDLTVFALPALWVSVKKWSIYDILSVGLTKIPPVSFLCPDFSCTSSASSGTWTCRRALVLSSKTRFCLTWGYFMPFLGFEIKLTPKTIIELHVSVHFYRMTFSFSLWSLFTVPSSVLWEWNDYTQIYHYFDPPLLLPSLAS